MKPGNSIRKKSLKLKVNEGIRFRLIGISSHENDYRLVWAINNMLHFQFTRTDSLRIYRPGLNIELEFSRFTYVDEDRILTYSLISNRCPDGFLFVEIRNFDFLVKITGEIREDETKEFVKKLKTVDVVSASFILEPEKLKGWRDILQE